MIIKPRTPSKNYLVVSSTVQESGHQAAQGHLSVTQEAQVHGRERAGGITLLNSVNLCSR